jgi:hypothetical protein
MNMMRPLVVRMFLQAKLVSALLFLFFASLSLGAAAGEVIVDEKLGFSIELPDNWVKMDASAFYDNLGKIEIEDEDFQKVLQKYANVPVVIATKYQEPYNDVNPSIKVNARPYGNLSTRDPVEIISLISAPLKSIFKDLRVIDEPNKMMLGDVVAAHVSIEYTLETEAGSFSIGSELIVVPTQHFFYMVGISYKQGGKEDAAVAKASALSFKLTSGTD